ncbi:MAG: hypothetical protein ACOC1P_06380 [Minisyncoccales bacterium]
MSEEFNLNLDDKEYGDWRDSFSLEEQEYLLNLEHQFPHLYFIILIGLAGVLLGDFIKEFRELTKEWEKEK